MKKFIIFLLTIACYNNSFGMFTKKLTRNLTISKTSFCTQWPKFMIRVYPSEDETFIEKSLSELKQELEIADNDLLKKNNALLHKAIKQNKENNELLKAIIKQHYVNAGYDGINSFHRY